MSDVDITTITDPRGGRAHLVHTDHVNWVILQDDSGVTLIDGGYPKQVDAVLASIREVGADPEQIRAALVTHAHVDHIGGLGVLAERYGFAVFMDPTEVPHGRREILQQATPLDIAKISYRPRVLRWLSGVIRLGVLDTTGIPSSEAFAASGPLDLPGRPVPVAIPGHTDGHSGYLVADGRVLVSGDALITAHGISPVAGPQCLHHAFQHDLARNRESLLALRDLEADTIFPGHGPVHHGSMADAVDTALSR
ncbi:MBL fold metallo-hydrolase [Williamsia maris]|uniref:Glyoxylase, beta-lactamase superfamily II n=1 Tax=Williamsia maris TaxID=72806 RepID=A0ABT1HEY8_9NOCA|nr:MBL fold metallo-hydrolase [Williamsia maris]MCP2176291.1 Glyoxylase, beta-lactamase superfamily II [Williamsia maris]